MNGSELLRIVDAIHRDKNIDQAIVFEGIEQAIVSAARKHFGEESEIVVDIDRDSGNPSVKVDGTDLEADEIGDLLGRIAAQTAKQVMIQKIREAERDALFDEFTAQRGQIVTGTVTQASGGAATVNLGKVDALLPRGEQIPGEYHRVGERVRAVVLEVKKAGSRVRIILSRTHPELVRRLFELEIPEVAEHVIEVRSLAREAGYRSKVAVSCFDNKIDCVGACVGVRGSRIKNVVDELAGERIDIVRWNDSLTVLVPNALQPAEVEDVILCPMLGKVIVLVQDDQLSLSIGKKGQNVRLASKLVGWDIHVLTQEKLDVQLDSAVAAFSKIPEVTEELAENLVAQGFFTFDDLSVIEPDQLAELGGLTAEECESIIEFADEESLKAEIEERKAKEIARLERAEAAAYAAANPPAAETEGDAETASKEADASAETPTEDASADDAAEEAATDATSNDASASAGTADAAEETPADGTAESVSEEGSSATATAVEPMAPVREPEREVTGRVRTIDAPIPTPKPSPKPAPKTPKAPEEPPAEAKEPAEPAAPEQEEPVEAVAETPKEQAEVSEEKTATKEPEPVEEEQADEPEVAEDDAKDEEDKSSDDAIEPISPEDYVPPTGAGGNVREMKPRGTLPSQGGGRRGKSKPRPSLPGIAAAPNYTPPKAKPAAKDDQPAQKPDIPLTAEVLAGDQSPLRQHLKQHRKKEGGAGSGLRPPLRRGGAPIEGEGGPSQQQRRNRRRAQRFERDESNYSRRSPRRRKRSGGPIVRKTEGTVEVPCTIRTFSEAVGHPASIFIKSLFQKGQMVTMNDTIDEETALELALEVGVDLEIKRPRDIEQELMEAVEGGDEPEQLVTRPPMITILGHVDHGKTTLLDTIRSGNVAEGEAGGITQHIAAYQVEHDNKKLTFVDTPGHAAFGEMRARGAGVTDIVVLVVAANDGVMPQTVECISHAKAAGVPIVVAMNKVDLPEINEQKVLQELAQHDVLPAEWGGDIEVVRTSATTGQGIDDLLETLLLTAELQEYTADPNRDAVGVCLEAFMDEGRGVLAWLIVQKGTLHVGDLILCGESYGRIRAMYDDHDNEITEAGPSTPIKIAGLDVVPGAGERFHVMSDVEEARTTADMRRHRGRAEVLATRGTPRTLEDILTEARGGIVQDLPLIIKADTPGSLEALRGEINKFEHPEVKVQIVHDGVGGVNESDVSLASASGAIIIAFHVIAEDRAQQLADREGVEIRRYQIIYEITETIKQALEGMLMPERVDVMTGRALVLQTFKTSRFGVIAGCRILSGTIERTNRIRVIRDQTVLNDYAIASLRREKDDVKEARLRKAPEEGFDPTTATERLTDLMKNPTARPKKKRISPSRVFNLRMQQGDELMRKARPKYFSAFAKKYPNVSEAKKTKCNVCHFGKKKKNRNDYGKALMKNISKNEKDAAKITAALEKTESAKNAKGETFGSLLKAGKLPGTAP
eukprot:g8409.t1